MIRISSAFVAVAIAAGAAGALSPSAQATLLPAGFTEGTLAHRLVEPTDHAWTPDGRLLVAEKAGRVIEFGTGGERRTLIDISDHVVNLRDRGLTGIAVDRDFAANGRLYLLYTLKANPDPAAAQVWRLTRVALSPDGGLVDPSDPETVVLGAVGSAPCPDPDDDSDCIPADTRFHGAGTVRSDPGDGTLWVGFGDDTSFDAADPHAFRAYDERSYTGKIVHVDRDGRGLPGHAFCPEDADLSHVCTKIHAKGFRNPFRFHLRAGAEPVVGDVGSRSRDEIDLAAAGGNYGWPCYEGTIRTPEYSGHPTCAAEYAKEGTPAAASPPVYDYSHEGLAASITGGPGYAGTEFPASYVGGVFFGDYATGRMSVLRLADDDSLAGVDEFARALGSPVDIELGPAGIISYVDIRWGAVRAIRHPDGPGPGAGGLELRDCIGEGAPGCKPTEAPPGALDGVNGLAFDAEGRNLYATAVTSGTLAHFARGGEGELRFGSCVSATVAGCDSVAPAEAMQGAHTVSISPDDRSAYTASNVSGTVEIFELDPVTGEPEFAGCIGRNRPGCAQSPVAAIRGAHTTAISPDGDQVYLAATEGDALIGFDRDPTTGGLTFAECHSIVATACTDLGGAIAVRHPHDLKFAPGGRDLYVPGYESDNIARFRRSQSGALTFAGCVGQTASGCEDIGGADALDGVHGVALSGDGTDLYAAAGRSGAITHFRRDQATGGLSFAGCVGRAAAGCSAFGGTALEGAHWVTVSPDDRGVYVASRDSSAISRFDRDPASGELTPRGCIAQGAEGCRSMSPVEALGGDADWVEWSPDGTGLHSTSFLGDTIARFALSGPSAGRRPSAPRERGFAVTLKLRRAQGVAALVGRVRSPHPGCVEGARVRVLRARPGRDRLAAKRRATATGRFRVRLKAGGDRAYAKVKPRTTASGLACGRARSRSVRL